jgi:hypothetical protein
MKALNRFALTGFVVLAGVCQFVLGGLAESGQDNLVRVYEVNKKDYGILPNVWTLINPDFPY